MQFLNQIIGIWISVDWYHKRPYYCTAAFQIDCTLLVKGKRKSPIQKYVISHAHFTVEKGANCAWYTGFMMLLSGFK